MDDTQLQILLLFDLQGTSSLANWYAKASVFASVSRYEPFGLAVLEAAQAGCALVLSDIPTFRELWDGAALFVPPEDPVALAEALRNTLQDDPSERGVQACQPAGRYRAAGMADGVRHE